MRTALIMLSGVFLLWAAYVVVMNWACVIASSRNRRKDIDRHHSTVPLVSLILAALAVTAWPLQGKLWLLVLPALDIANWMILAMPFQLLRERRKDSSH